MVVHAGRRGLMEVIRDDQHRLVVKIIDHGSGMAPGRFPALPPPDALEGRGRWLAGAMCDRMQINSDASGQRLRATEACLPFRPRRQGKQPAWHSPDETG